MVSLGEIKMTIKERRIKLGLFWLQLKSSDVEERQLLREIRVHDEAFAVFCAMLKDAAGDDVHTLGALTNFLDWLIENKDAIIELIRTIIGLFS
jgi:hypothetical protein